MENSNILTPPEDRHSLLLEHYQAGRYDVAKKLAFSTTQEFPHYQFGWDILGATLNQLCKYNEALNAFRESVKLAPQDSSAHYNCGLVLVRLRKFEESKFFFEQALLLEPSYVQALVSLADTLKILGKIEEAKDSYTKAIEINPDTFIAYNNLGILLKEQGKVGEAESSFRSAIMIEPRYAEAHANLGVIFKDLGRVDEAEASLTHAVNLDPGFAVAFHNLGLLLIDSGRYQEAETMFRRALEVDKNHAEARYSLGLNLYALRKYDEAIEQFKLSKFSDSESQLLRCLYLKNEQRLFLEQLDYLIDKGEINSIIGSISSRAASKYKTNKINVFCQSPFDYVSKIDLKEKYDFEKIFLNTTKFILNKDKVQFRSQHLLTNGKQTTGNLFVSEPTITKEIQKIIRIEVEEYRAKYDSSKDGFLLNWPANYSIFGWLVSMKSGGSLKPHMHERGWISGSLYLNVPPKNGEDSGSLVVCIEDDSSLISDSTNPKTVIDVNTGDLVLFPSSLHHYTVPFKSKEERIVLAFDIVPSK